jgi:hypothetical protein
MKARDEYAATAGEHEPRGKQVELGGRMGQTKQRRRSRQSASEVDKQGFSDTKSNETVLLIAPEEPNPNTVSAIVSEWVAPRLADEFLREQRYRLPNEEMEVSRAKS